MNEHIRQAVCLTDNYPDGQKICGVRLVYDRPVAAASADTYHVEGRNITGVTVDGDTVTVALNIRDKKAAIIAEPEGKIKPGEKPSGPPKLPETVRQPRQVDIIQQKDLAAVDGTVLPAWPEPVSTHAAVEPVIEDFQQFEFEGLGYNLFVPETEAKVPLVVFIHDAGPCGADTKITLSQGNGAINFAKPEWQKEHPCYVLAPQIPRGVKLTNDKFEASDELLQIKALIDDVAERYNVDQDRIYLTGQSMGCMASCELNIRDPDRYAASLLVAGQWSPERMAAQCTEKSLWILVSNHDAKAFPGMNAVTEAMEAKGAKIGRYTWNAKAGAEALEAAVTDALRNDVNIRYTVFEGSSVVPDYKDDNPATNHMETWPVVYEIEGLKRWLFSCHL